MAIAQEGSSARTLSTVSVTEAKPRADLLTNSAKNPFRTPESSSNHTQTITREEIEQLRPRDVFELLNFSTGVIATQGSRKGFTGLAIRGDSNFRWIIDGAYLQPTMASRILASLPVMAIEEVKVVRGGSALTLAPMVGSASPGGAPVDGFVILRTRKPQKDVAQVRAAVESFNANQAGAWLGKTLGGVENKGYIAGVLSSSYTEGPSEKLDNNASYSIGRKSTGGMVKGGFEASGITVDLMAYQDEGRFSIPNTNSHGSLNRPGFQGGQLV